MHIVIYTCMYAYMYMSICIMAAPSHANHNNGPQREEPEMCAHVMNGCVYIVCLGIVDCRVWLL